MTFNYLKDEIKFFNMMHKALQTSIPKSAPSCIVCHSSVGLENAMLFDAFLLLGKLLILQDVIPSILNGSPTHPSRPSSSKTLF